ncbi:MAG: SPOR domain-containing protein [Pseudomonadota bacterium]|jgi:DedD protein
MTDNNSAGAQPDELKKKLVRRIALAGALIVILLGALAVFDEMMKPPPAPSTAQAPAVVQPPVPEQPTQAVTKAEEVKPEEAKGEEPQAEPERTAVPALPTSEPRQQAAAPKPEPRAAPRKENGERSVPAVAPPAKAAPARAYLFQVGVFHELANAQELQARLASAGIPAQIEARVQVGPFKSRAEADEARARLRSLGLAPMLVHKR